MLNETVTQSHILTPGVEQSFGTLAAPHELTEIIVNANGAVAANSSEWRLYDVSPAGAALIWRGVLTPPFEMAQRLTPPAGIAAGSQIELRAELHPSIVVATSVAVTASLIGYDPNCCDGATGTGAGGDGTALYVWGRHAFLNDMETGYLAQGFDPREDPDSPILTTNTPVPIVRDGILRNLYILQNSVGEGLGNTEYTIVINGVDTALAANVFITSGSGSNLVDEVAVFAGDTIGLKVFTSGADVTVGPSNITVSLEFAAA